MVTLLIGRAGTGKSQAILERMTAAHKERRQILIVPEQYSHRAERRVCDVGGNSLSLGSEVLTFTRLATRVFAQAGGLAAPTLDEGGRLLVMYLAVKEMSEGLSVYRRPSRKSAFLAGLLDTLDECKSYQAGPEALAKAGSELGGATGDKLRDLGLIFTAYDRLCGELGADPRDKLTRLATALKESGWAAGMDFYLDGFTDFTPQQGLVLSALMEVANSVTFALTCDHLVEDEDGLGIFSPARKTAAYLKRLARDAGQEVVVETAARKTSDKAPQLIHLEQNLFAQTLTPQPGGGGVVCAALPDPRREVEWVCAQILRLVREEGYRFRDIAVTARSLEGYEALIEDSFPRFGIPVFLARTQDILEKPVMALITSALAAVSGGYGYEDMFRYLKTGLAGVDDDRDKLENYVIAWDIKGGKWTTPKPWRMHPGGYGLELKTHDKAAVATLDALRRRIIAPLERLRTTPGTTGRDRAIALYDFLEEIRLPETLEARVELLTQRGELNLAEEYKQLWDILVGALETCGHLLRDVEMDMEEFAKLFALTLSQYQVGSIPVALDRVTVGPCPRLGYESYKAVFFLGCDDKRLPQCTPSPGLLTDDDRSALERLGLTLAPRLEDKLCREMTIAYNACTLPTQRLYVTYPAAWEGEERRGSFLIHRLTALFPDAWAGPGQDPRLAAAETALELAGTQPLVRQALERVPGMEQRLERMEAATTRGRGALSRAGVTALYGKRVPMSASRLDLYRSCHFSYFMRYGLDAQPRRKAGFDAPEYGTFIHAVLEEVLKSWDKTMDEEAVHALTHRAMERYLNEELGGLEDKSPRFVYLFRRLEKTVERVVDNVTAELRSSDFQPIAFELGFGRGDKDLPPVELELDGVRLSVSGFVDRVDGWEHDGKLYLRVVDYKTGRKSFDFTDIFNGLGLQMLLYLFTLEERGTDYFGKDIVPAGALYIPARDALVAGNRDMEESVRLAEVDKSLKRKGLLLADEDVLTAMEPPEEAGRFLPVRVNKEGAFTGEALASLEQLGKLSAHVERILEEVGKELAAGTVAADPYWLGPEQNACVWCPYAAACQFEDGRGGDCRRWGRHLTAREFWDALEGGGGDGV